MKQMSSKDDEGDVSPSRITFEEQFRDHDNKIEEYIQNCIFRGYNSETTIKTIRSVLKSVFKRVQIIDQNHPEGRRQLFFCEIMDPKDGPSRLGQIIESLLEDGMAYDTRRKIMSHLRNFCSYVMAKPNVPGHRDITFGEKYGPMILPFTKYDLPIHAQDRPRRQRHALSSPRKFDLYEFMRTEYMPAHEVTHIAARNYTAVVLAAETGARVSELISIRSSKESCDIDSSRGRIRLFGKGKPGSGKRIRWVNLSPLSAEVLRVYETAFRPLFPRVGEIEYLFPNKDGTQLTGTQFWRFFKKIVRMAIASGIELPPTLRPHDLRRTYATIELERNPLGYRKILKQLGHSYPSSIAPYIVATDDDVEEEQSDLLDVFLDPSVNNLGVR
jgi:integrase